MDDWEWFRNGGRVPGSVGHEALADALFSESADLAKVLNEVHASPSAPTIQVSPCFHMRERKVAIKVCDASPREVVRRDLDLMPSENGRGLMIIAACSKEWGIKPERGGKPVWFVISLD